MRCRGRGGRTLCPVCAARALLLWLVELGRALAADSVGAWCSIPPTESAKPNTATAPMQAAAAAAGTVAFLAPAHSPSAPDSSWAVMVRLRRARLRRRVAVVPWRGEPTRRDEPTWRDEPTRREGPRRDEPTRLEGPRRDEPTRQEGPTRRLRRGHRWRHGRRVGGGSLRWGRDVRRWRARRRRGHQWRRVVGQGSWGLVVHVLRLLKLLRPARCYPEGRLAIVHRAAGPCECVGNECSEGKLTQGRPRNARCRNPRSLTSDPRRATPRRRGRSAAPPGLSALHFWVVDGSGEGESQRQRGDVGQEEEKPLPKCSRQASAGGFMRRVLQRPRWST